MWNYTGLEAEDRPDPMARVFPKLTKCTFHKYGASGTVEKKDGLCVLPQNIINEKIFLFVWFWLVFVAVVTGMFLIYRIVTLAGAQLRVALITVHVSYYLISRVFLKFFHSMKILKKVQAKKKLVK